jgi:hypothetical protein
MQVWQPKELQLKQLLVHAVQTLPLAVSRKLPWKQEMQVAKLLLLQMLQPVKQGRHVPMLSLMELSTDPARQSLQVEVPLAAVMQLPQLSPHALPPLLVVPLLSWGWVQVPLLVLRL